jgi:hypothetical protein
MPHSTCVHEQTKGYGDILRCDAVLFGKWIPTNRRNLLPPSSGQKNNSSKETAKSKATSRGTRGSYPGQGSSTETASGSNWYYPPPQRVLLDYAAAHPRRFNRRGQANFAKLKIVKASTTPVRPEHAFPKQLMSIRTPDLGALNNVRLGPSGRSV